MNVHFEATLYPLSGSPVVREPEVILKEDEYRVTIPKSWFTSFPCEKAELRSPLTRAAAGSEGAMFYSTNAGRGIVLTRFREDRPACSFESCIGAMPLGGFVDCANAVFFYVTGMDSDAYLTARFQDGQYELFPVFQLDGDEPDEDMTVRFRCKPWADYSEMARYYRAYQMREKGCVPLKERVRTNPVLKQAVEGVELRIRMGWKPVPSPVLHQTPETEPPMKVACDIKTVSSLLDRLQEKGVKNAEICLVGWGEGGHDGRFPQQLPSDPRYGTQEEMKRLIRKALDMGYLMTCHVATTCAYEVADNWDANLLGYEKTEDGGIRPMLRGGYRKTGLSGGLPYSLCAKTSYEHYVLNDFPKIRAYGFRGLFYDDVLTIIKADKCYHPDHPVTRKQAREYYRKIARYSRELFGGFQSEGWFDFMNSDVDYVLYTSFKTHITPEDHPLFDEGIPFFQLVYHGIVPSNATSETVNYPIKRTDEHLRVLEWGSRPLLYIYSKFGDEKNWMGDLDLHTDTPEETERTAEAISQAYREYEILKDLQYRFMEKHEKTGDGQYRTTFSDGTVIDVDYGSGTYRIMRKP